MLSSLLDDLIIVVSVERVGLSRQRIDALGALAPRGHSGGADVVRAGEHRKGRDGVDEPHDLEPTHTSAGVVALAGEPRGRVGSGRVGSSQEERALRPTQDVDSGSPGHLVTEKN